VKKFKCKVKKNNREKTYKKSLELKSLAPKALQGQMTPEEWECRRLETQSSWEQTLRGPSRGLLLPRWRTLWG
jgi:hypothetical protein